VKFFKRHILQETSYLEAVTAELEEARLSMLRAETAFDWAQSNCDYNYSRIERLERKLHELQQKLPPRS
jgi:polyhydroxyalkanoate synthesis regulator phasin